VVDAEQDDFPMNNSERGAQIAPPALSARDVEMARSAQRRIMKALSRSRTAAITLTTTDGEQPSIELPPAALKLIGQLLGAMSEGRPLLLTPSKQEFSTVEAADFLNVSRPFVIKEIDEGRLPHRKVGTHRRVAVEDLLEYAREMRKQQEHALDKMAENARDLGLDY
jgi:excisionase family DNA binding protein